MLSGKNQLKEYVLPPEINGNKWPFSFLYFFGILIVSKVRISFVLHNDPIIDANYWCSGHWHYWWGAINVRLWALLKIHAHRNNLPTRVTKLPFYDPSFNIHKDINKGPSQHVLYLGRKFLSTENQSKHRRSHAFIIKVNLFTDVLIGSGWDLYKPQNNMLWRTKQKQ